MYQVTWSRERTLPHEMVRKLETWKEVQSWKADLDALDDVMYWTIAVSYTHLTLPTILLV